MLKIIPLGGMAVTKNLFVYETDEEILLVDGGIGFPDETMLGVDLLIPDTTYLQNTKKKIVGMLLTHGHDDHIAGLPYILPKLPEFPLFASRLTAGFAAERMKEFSVMRRINIIDDVRGVRLGKFAIESIRVTHSVPDARHFVITTPNVSVYHGSDFKFDLTPIDGVRPDFQKIADIGKRGVTVLLSDCLRSERPGFSASESSLNESLEAEIRDTKGKLIVTTMSSNVHRIQQAAQIAARAGRRIALFGRSVEVNARVAQELGFLKLPKQAMVKKKSIRNIPDNQLCLIVAGSQGQEGSALVRAARGEHREIKIQPSDKVVFSADPIPGNERAVYETIDALAHRGAEVIYHDVNDELHVSGHASSGELMLLMELLKPKYLVPIGGTYRHMVQYRKLGEKMGYSADRVFLLEEGQSLEINMRGEARIGETIPLKNVMVDGLGIGDVGKVVLRDRQLMAEEGMLVVIVPIEKQTGKISGDVEIISRGVVFMKESKQLMDKARGEVYTVIKSIKTPIREWRAVKEGIRKRLERLFSKELERFPLIIPIIIRT
ncbi:ribonuclease J [Patescibacteria group bacterium]|nr:ribonuclease J [Patescibacteria group bacterium]